MVRITASILPRVDAKEAAPPAAARPAVLTATGRLAAAQPAGSPAENRFREAQDLAAAGRREEAVAALEAAVQLDPRHAGAWGWLARALGELRQFDRAYAAMERFAALLPGKAAVHVERARLHHAAGRWKEAEAECDAALRLQPSPAGRFVLALLLLAYGRLQEGFALLEARQEVRAPKMRNLPPAVDYPAWQGEPLEGRSLLVWPEWGAGDEIQMARFAAELKARGASRVTWATLRPELVELLGSVPGVDAVVPSRVRPLPRHDYWCRMMSLPARLGTTLDALPERLPYLRSSPERRQSWASRLPAGFRVGLVWRGAPIHSNDRHRSLPGLHTLAPLWQVPGVTFVSLQKGAAEQDALQPPSSQPLVALGHAFRDFADTAAVIDQLDLVICVDTSVAHLAGALGKPVWVLLPAWDTDWRWMLEREDSPWYPGVMRLFRQREPGNWTEAVQAVAQALRARVQAAAPRQLRAQGRLVMPAAPTPESLRARGQRLLEGGHTVEAHALFRRARHLAPELASGHAARALVLHATGRDQEAEAHYRKALQEHPAQAAELQRQLGLLLLRCGRYQEGWALYESRADPTRIGSSTLRPRLPFPEWKGEPLQGRSILVWPEQGAGDQIQFARYAAVLKARGAARVSIATSVPGLLPLLARVPGVDQACSSGSPVLAHDYWSFAMSLPLHIGTTVETIPAALPYLFAPPGRKASWAQRLPSGPRVGLVWRGAAAHRNDHNRSLPGLATLAPLWSVSGVQFVSLQKGAGEDEAQDPPPGQPLLALGHEFRDFADTAAVIDQLDLVICVDTSVAHLAGAMGKPVWVLLPAWSTDWRWLPGRSDSPWYPGVMRLFRQCQAGHWADTVAEVAAALREWASTHPSPPSSVSARPPSGVSLQPTTSETASQPSGGLQPCGVEALIAQGVRLHGQGRLAEAEAALRDAVRRQPGHATACANLGIFLGSTGRTAEALELLRKSTQLDPTQANSWGNLGTALQAQGQTREAEAAYRRALDLSPGLVPARVGLVRLLASARRLDEAEAACRQGLAAVPDAAALHALLGDVLGVARRWAEAEAAYRAALARDGRHAPAWCGLGTALGQQARAGEAQAAFQAALALEPARASTHAEYGVLLHHAGRLEEAGDRYRQALALQPADLHTRLRLSHLLLGMGRLSKGWLLHEARYDPANPARYAEAPKLPFPPWQGEPLQDRSLVLWPEQGLGDAIQAIRYAPLLKARGVARLTVLCAPPLKALFETAPDIDHVVTRYRDVARHDYWCLQMSLPLRLGTTLETIPAALPYLRAPVARRELWAPQLPPGRKVGLAWKGSPGHANDAWRSLPGLATLAPLWQVRGLQFVSLQKGQGEQEALAPPPGQPLLALGQRFADLADAAAVIEQLDLVICVDTVTAHLAGALGKPVWVLLPAWGVDWRWLYDGRTDSPWYPRVMRLFRQQRPGDWAPVVEQVAQALREWAAQPPASA